MNPVHTSGAQAIVVEDTFPHPPQVLWTALTSRALIGRWLMPAEGFEPVVGNRFTFKTKPAGEWDGTISCEVVEVSEPHRLSYTWSGGHAGNVGYGSRLETLVTITLTAVEAGTRLQLVHSGFQLPDNDIAYRNMSDGWKVVTGRLAAVIDEANQ